MAGKPSIKTMSISTRLFIIVCVFFMLAGVVVVALVHYQMRQQAWTEAEEKALTILERTIAIHNYFTRKLKPKLFELTDSMRSDEYFEPIWMSSAYAVRHIDKDHKTFGTAEYYYKACTINARSPENEADAYEKAFIDELNANPELVSRSDVRILDDKPYFVMMRRAKAIKEACLRCHGNPDKAPGDLVRYYDPERGFHRKVGDLVSAASIRVPLSSAYAQANSFSLQLSALLLVVIGCLFGIHLWLNKRLLFDPLASIREKALLISSSSKHLGEGIPVPSGRELNELTTTFNAMSASLRQSMDQLENRTADLAKSKVHLEKEIEERKQMEEALKESEKRFRVLFEQAADSVVLIDRKTQAVVDFNDLAHLNLGFTREEFRDIKIQDLEVVESPEEIKRHAEKVRREGGDTFETRLRAKTSEIHDFLMKVRSVSFGGKDYFLSIWHEITERKRAEEALRESQEHYRTIFESAPVGIFHSTPEGKIISANPATARILGYESPDELMAVVNRSSIAEALYVHPERRPPAIDMALAQEGWVAFENQYHRKDGEVITGKLLFRAVRNSDGTISRLEGFIEDITERVRTEEALRASEASLRKSQEKYRILAGKLLSAQEAERRLLAREMHDDLTQRLAVLAIEAGRLEQQLQSSPDPISDKLREMKGMLVELSEDVHAISRQLHPSILDDLGLVDAIESECTSFARREGIVVNYETKGVQPTVPKDVALCIYRIIQEGLRNIAKHAQASEARISLICKDNSIHLSIKDNGIGFDPTEAKIKTGIGLASMEERVRLIQGKIRVKTKPGEGATINVWVPLSGGKA